MTITLDRGYGTDDTLESMRAAGLRYNVVCPTTTSHPLEEVQVGSDEDGALTEFQVPTGRFFCPGTTATAEMDVPGPPAAHGSDGTYQTVYASMVREHGACTGANSAQGTGALKFMSNIKWGRRLVLIPASGCNRQALFFPNRLSERRRSSARTNIDDDEDADEDHVRFVEITGASLCFLGLHPGDTYSCEPPWASGPVADTDADAGDGDGAETGADDADDADDGGPVADTDAGDGDGAETGADDADGAGAGAGVGAGVGAGAGAGAGVGAGVGADVGAGAGACAGAGASAGAGAGADTGAATDDGVSGSCHPGGYMLKGVPLPPTARRIVPAPTLLHSSAYRNFTRGRETPEDVLQGDVLATPPQTSDASKRLATLHDCFSTTASMEQLLSCSVVPLTGAQKTVDWFILRRFRVTSSVASLFSRLAHDADTYGPTAATHVWAKLALTWFDTRRFGSASTRTAFRVGQLNENAVAAHLKSFLLAHHVVVQFRFAIGLVANVSLPWLAASPDLLVLLDNGGVACVEIKTTTTDRTRDKLLDDVKTAGAYCQDVAPHGAPLHPPRKSPVSVVARRCCAGDDSWASLVQHKHQVLHQAATLQVRQVLYVRADETSIQQVVHITFSTADLVAHVASLLPFVRRYLRWVYDRNEKMEAYVPRRWKDVVDSHFQVWRQLNDPVVARHGAAITSMREKFGDAFFVPKRVNDHTGLVWSGRTTTREGDDAWRKLAKGPWWPVRSIKTEQQVRERNRLMCEWADVLCTVDSLWLCGATAVCVQHFPFWRRRVLALLGHVQCARRDNTISCTTCPSHHQRAAGKRVRGISSVYQPQVSRGLRLNAQVGWICGVQECHKAERFFLRSSCETVSTAARRMALS